MVTTPTDVTAPLRAVCAVLDGVQKPGAFFASGDVDSSPAVPELAVPGVGAISLPVTAKSAKALIAKATLAPYGHGEETLVDKSVRNTWELNPSEFELNAKWQKDVVDPLAAGCARRMGVATPASVRAKLYKLLVYESGGKFELHQDSEKEPGMFGTLVVLLPSAFQGGELVVYPPGQQNQREGTPHRWRGGYMGMSNMFYYAAFYADCEHAVEPVTRGYRVCLTYNLVIPPGRRKKPQLAQFDTKVPELTAALHTYFTTPTVKKNGAGA